MRSTFAGLNTMVRGLTTSHNQYSEMRVKINEIYICWFKYYGTWFDY
ncbi:MAG: hypothetical protein H6Q70_4693 [Firmicutes bacterium]|nr:hypothetical protein [Bacillota bacterium]